MKNLGSAKSLFHFLKSMFNSLWSRDSWSEWL